MTSDRFFSWKGTLPCAISTMRELSGWQQVTGVPKSARQAEMTVPRYPAPYTPICILPPLRYLPGQEPQSFIYRADGMKGRVRKGHAGREKVHAQGMVTGTVISGECVSRAAPRAKPGISGRQERSCALDFPPSLTCILQVICARVPGCPKGPSHLGVRPARSAFLSRCSATA